MWLVARTLRFRSLGVGCGQFLILVLILKLISERCGNRPPRTNPFRVFDPLPRFAGKRQQMSQGALVRDTYGCRTK